MPESFWPQDLGEAALRTPVSILKEQASFLGEQTRQLLKGEVATTSASEGRFVHNFNIIAPTLNAYRYQLFYVVHSMTLYPLNAVHAGTTYNLSTEDKFVEWLKQVLGSPETKRVIEALLAQVKS